jgi:mercuric ion binding protein
MMKRLLVVSVVILVSFVSRGAYADQISVAVKGMVCSFCAQGIKKTFLRKDGVESVEVDLDKKIVTITTKQGANLTDTDVKESIVDAGYEVLSIKRKA